MAAIMVPTQVIPLMLVLLVAHMIGLMVERWLFFAEAQHVVNLYY
jgi:DMSO reductase anchor subunit